LCKLHARSHVGARLAVASSAKMMRWVDRVTGGFAVLARAKKWSTSDLEAGSFDIGARSVAPSSVFGIRHLSCHDWPRMKPSLEPSVEQADIANWLEDLRIEHRDLDDVIRYLIDTHHPDLMKIQRLKKRKLKLKDMITKLESELIPDLDA
jgi:hypothetical protein